MFHSDQKSAAPKTMAAKKFNFLAAEHDKHETIVALNKICKIIRKRHTHIVRYEEPTSEEKTKDLSNKPEIERLLAKSGLTVRRWVG